MLIGACNFRNIYYCITVQVVLKFNTLTLYIYIYCNGYVDKTCVEMTLFRKYHLFVLFDNTAQLSTVRSADICLKWKTCLKYVDYQSGHGNGRWPGDILTTKMNLLHSMYTNCDKLKRIPVRCFICWSNMYCDMFTYWF